MTVIRGQLSRFAGNAANLQGEKASRRIALAAAAASVLGILYLVQAYSPLRLDNDSVVYLHMATDIVDGRPMDSRGLPPGYPALIAVIDKLGLGYAFVFTLVNCAFIALGLACVNSLFQKSRGERITSLVPLAMLSFVFVRYLAMPEPEAMFFGVSMAALAAMSSADSGHGKRRFVLLGAAMVLTLVAITVRFVGFALLPALLWACVHRDVVESRKSISRISSGKWLAVAALIAAAIVSPLVLNASFRKYSFEAIGGFTEGGPVAFMSEKARGFLANVAELTLNVPWTQFRSYLHLFVLAGLVATVLILSIVRMRFPRTPAGVYLACFLLALVVWPFNAVRLWLPIVPLLIGYLQGSSLRFETGPKWKLLLKAYYAWFAFAGACALGYTTRITLSGKNFPKVYGVAGGMSAPNPETGKADEAHNQRARELQARYGNPF